MQDSFRSEEMRLCQLIIKDDCLYECMLELGRLGLAQFNNLNQHQSVQSLRFINEVRRCGDLEQSLKFLKVQIDAVEMKIPPLTEASTDPELNDFSTVGSAIEKLHTEYRDVTKNSFAIKKLYTAAVERRCVLNKTSEFFNVDGGEFLVDAFGGGSRADDFQLEYLAGTVPSEKFFSFEKILWRVCQSNYYLRHSDIEQPLCDPIRCQRTRKVSFIIFFQSELIKSKVKKICQGFGVLLYPCPRTTPERLEAVQELNTEIADLTIVISQTADQTQRILKTAAENLNLWALKVRKIKAMFFVMNHFKVDDAQKYFVAECWVPLRDIAHVRQVLKTGAMKAETSFVPILTEIASNERIPPTYFATNKYTSAFQVLINSYGIASYREMNPMPFTIVTFPFLFAVMFGDIGHGVIMLLFAMWMIFNEALLEKRQSQNEIWNVLFAGRYVVFSMGAFSIYTGFIYNDIFSKSFNIFGSHWAVHYNVSTVQSNKHLQLDPSSSDYKQNPYWFGLDPVWDASGEEAIVAINSYKMKLSIVLGVFHMILGIALSAVNKIVARDFADLVLVVLPHFLFLASLFLYLVVLILFKWSNYGSDHPPPYNSACAPSILITFIDMILLSEGKPVSDDCSRFMFAGQNVLQKLLVAIAFLSIPVMLLGKPVYFWRKRHSEEVRKRIKANLMRKSFSTSSMKLRKRIKFRDDEDDVDIENRRHAGQPEMSELLIHQGIHTIECVLGSVSHTASYLRLWALSLAHEQLSTVLWDMVLRIGLRKRGFLGVVFIVPMFAIWAVLTIGVLVLMEGLSAFLHTLRLHWVEFQSKFYLGDGEVFVPFSFNKIANEDFHV